MITSDNNNKYVTIVIETINTWAKSILSQKVYQELWIETNKKCDEREVTLSGL